MNGDICKRVIEWEESFCTIERPCNKPKNHDFIYCDDCMKEILDTPPRYQCFVEGCPANHPSKYEVCHADTLPQ